MGDEESRYQQLNRFYRSWNGVNGEMNGGKTGMKGKSEEGKGNEGKKRRGNEGKRELREEEMKGERGKRMMLRPIVY